MHNHNLGLNEAQFEPEQEQKLRTAQFHIQYIPIQVVKLQHKYKNKDHFKFRFQICSQHLKVNRKIFTPRPLSLRYKIFTFRNSFF